MGMSSADTAAYFTRISYTAPREPSLAVLRGIIAAHATSIPFENLDVLLGRGVRLDTDALVDKLVHRRRGGYCFEHNSLLLGVLAALGFEVHGLAARVLWGRREGEVRPRTHMLLRLRLPEGDFLADVGFGGVTLTAPLRFETGAEQATPHEPHRLVAGETGGEIQLQVRLDGEWTRLYQFLPGDRQYPIDYDMANWFTATHPTSLFVSNLMAARPDADRRYALINRDFTIRPRSNSPERRMLADPTELGDVLTRYFHIPPLETADLVDIWDRIGQPRG
ncbi:MAG TPA: arylamine N-acetyltransferase [Stellaceae bacterium]|jgi:N-hydroxyarylamine O-acetyltransferase|nr:arylamine N-acetyltransferase [Stellaceae bacterium]